MQQLPSGDEQLFALTCPVCGVYAEAELLAQHATPGGPSVGPGPIPRSKKMSGVPNYVNVYNFLVRCKHCQSAILIMRSYGNDHVREVAYTAGTLIFPLARSGFLTDRLARESIPAAILEDLRQAELAHAAGAPYGAGLLLRRACQYVCGDKGATKHGLADQIDELASQGIITQHLAKLASRIKIVGDELAHPDANTPFVIEDDDVLTARRFLEQLIRAVYIEPAEVQRLEASLQARGVKRKR